jgi:hypothetical protein
MLQQPRGLGRAEGSLFSESTATDEIGNDAFNIPVPAFPMGTELKAAYSGNSGG